MRTQTIDRIVNSPALPWPVFMPMTPVSPQPVPLPSFTPAMQAVPLAARPLPRPIALLRRAHPSLRLRAEIRPAELPMPAMSVATVDGRRIPVVGSVTRVSAQQLRKAFDLGIFDRLMKVSADGSATMIRDNEEIDLLQPWELKVVRPSTAS